MGTSLSSYSFRASPCGLIWTPKTRCITLYDLASEVTQYHCHHILLVIKSNKSIPHLPKIEEVETNSLPLDEDVTRF